MEFQKAGALYYIQKENLMYVNNVKAFCKKRRRQKITWKPISDIVGATLGNLFTLKQKLLNEFDDSVIREKVSSFILTPVLNVPGGKNRDVRISSGFQ